MKKGDSIARYFPIAILLLGVCVLVVTFPAWAPQRLRPSYYVGVRACFPCHGGSKGCDQYSLWRLSDHAEAYAALSLPEAFEIAEISGVDVEPRESPICLGCHATASNAEPWQIDPTFRQEDGVQCEVCHGPASNHMEALQSGKPSAHSMLPIPTPEDCMVCHRHKDTHKKVLGSVEFDYDEALQKISHTGSRPVMRPSVPTPSAKTNPHLVGVRICAQCHSQTEDGDQFGMWLRSAHADSYAVLGTSRAWELAAKGGLQGNPQGEIVCLQCHAASFGKEPCGFGESFEVEEGVQFESCHGPGSDYAKEFIMRDREAAIAAGLVIPGEKRCLACHNGECPASIADCGLRIVESELPNPKSECPVSSEDFDYATAVRTIHHPRKSLKPRSVSIEYKTPFNLILSKDGRLAYVTCEGSDSLVIADLESRKVVAEVEVGHQPHGVCLNPTETIAYVSNRGSDTVSVVDLKTNEVASTIVVGDEPHGVITDTAGETIYVVNAGTSDISVIDAHNLTEVKRLAAARGPWAIDRSPDGKLLYVTNNLSHFVPFRAPSLSEVSVIDTERKQIINRIWVREANLVQGIDFSPAGEFALVTLLRTKNLVPVVRVAQGWVITNGLGILWKDGRVDQVLLDEPNACFADPTDVVITPDKRFAYVTGGGIDAVAVVDLPKLFNILKSASDDERSKIIPILLLFSKEDWGEARSRGRCPEGCGPAVMGG